MRKSGMPKEENDLLEVAMATHSASESADVRTDALGTILRLATEGQYLCVRLKASNYLREKLNARVIPSEATHLHCVAVDGKLVSQPTA